MGLSSPRASPPQRPLGAPVTAAAAGLREPGALRAGAGLGGTEGAGIALAGCVRGAHGAVRRSSPAALGRELPWR